MVADLASLMVLVVLCFPRGGLPLPLLVLIVVSGILLACYAVNNLGLHPAVGKYVLRRTHGGPSALRALSDGYFSLLQDKSHNRSS